MTRSLDDIQHDIETTRERMSDTLGQLEYRLKPSRLAHQAEGHLRGSRQPVRSYGSSLKRAVYSDAIPAALAVLGVAWLISRLMGSRTNRPR